MDRTVYHTDIYIYLIHKSQYGLFLEHSTGFFFAGKPGRKFDYIIQNLGVIFYESPLFILRQKLNINNIYILYTWYSLYNMQEHF